MAVSLKSLYQKYGKPVANAFNNALVGDNIFSRGVESSHNFVSDPNKKIALPNVQYNQPFSKAPITNAFKGAANLGIDTVNSIVGRGIIDPAMDLGRVGSNAIDLARGQQIDLRPGQFRSGASQLGNRVITGGTPQQFLANAGQIAMPIINAYQSEVLNSLSKPTLLSKVKLGAMTGAKIGGALGVAQGLAGGADKTLPQQIGGAVKGGVQSAAIGGLIGGAVPVAGGIINKTVKGARQAGKELSATGSVRRPGFAKFIPDSGIETDPAIVQKIKNSIAEGEMILKSGKTATGRKMSPEELIPVLRAVNNSKAKIGASPSLPPHLQAVVDKDKGFSVQDVTPSGYGPEPKSSSQIEPPKATVQLADTAGLAKSQPLSETGAQQIGTQERILPGKLGKGEKIVAPSKDITDKYAGNINLNNLNVDNTAKTRLSETVNSLRPELEKVKGRTLSNQEVLDAAKASDVLQRGISRENTLKATSAITKLRQTVASGSEGKGLSEDFIKNIETLSSYAADAGRTLHAFGIGADSANQSIKESIVKDLLRLGTKTDEIMAASKDVDFENPKEVTAFYRQFVKPNLSDVLDEYRYINLLSSPQTHITNAFSNLLQTTVTSPTTKLFTGAIDAVGSALSGKERSAYVREVPAYTKGIVNSLGDAFGKFGEVISGNKFVERPDVSQIPTGSKVLAAGQVVPRALEATDAFFRTLMTGGEKEALAYKYSRSGKTVAEDVLNKQAADKASYYIFRGPVDPANKTGQGALLSGIDQMTNAVYGLRKVPGVKWFIPFVQTPMNILKQGIEYSPAGLLTLPGAANKQEQLAKTLIGSIAFAGAGMMALNGDSTWAAPTSDKDKELFYATGRKPYAIKIGDEWVSYSKLGPLAYPIALASAVKYEFQQNPKAATKGNLEKLASLSGDMAKFMSDQSYVQGIGDLVKALQGDTSAAKQTITNLPTQLIPLSSLQGWVSRLLDPVFRNPSNYTESITNNIPGLSKSVPAYTDPFGQPSIRENNAFNSFSPIQVNPTNKTFEPLYQQNQVEKQSTAQANALKKGIVTAPISTNGQPSSNADIHALPDGKFAYVIDGSVKTAKSQKAAELDIAKDNFTKSDSNFQAYGDNVFRKSKDGVVSVMSKLDFENKLQSTQLSAYKAGENVEGWMQTAEKQAKNIQQQLQDPNIDELDKAELQNKLVSLVKEYVKYKGYGGFTKPKVKTPRATGASYATSKPSITPRIRLPQSLPKSPTFNQSAVSKVGFGRL